MLRHLNFLKRKFASTLGIDITANSIKILQLTLIDGCYFVENYARTELPSGVMDRGFIQDVNVFIDSFSLLIKQIAPHSLKAVICLPDSLTIKKALQISDKLNESDIKELVLIEVDKLIHRPINEISYDFKLVNASHKTKILTIFASRLEYINQRVEILKQVGLRTRVVDIESNAILRVLKFIQSQYAFDFKKSQAWIELGALHTKIFVFTNMEIIFVNEDEFGVKVFSNADEYKYELLTRLKRSLKFFYASDNYAELEIVFLSGGGYHQNLLPFLIDNLKLDVRLINPFLNINFVNQTVADLVMRDYMMLTTSLGLALRQ